MTEHEFNTIFNTYRMYIFNYVNKTIGSRPDAEEITSTVFIKMWNTQPVFITEEQTKAWLFKTAKRKCFDHIKMHKHRMLREKVWIAEVPEWEELNIIELDAHTATLQRIIEMIKSYTKQERLVFNLHFIEGLKPREISKILKSSPQTISNQLTAIRNKIKKGQ